MAVPPNIPTSFVPRPGAGQRASGFDIATGFRVVSMGILLITIIAAGSVGGYAWYLKDVEKKQEAALATAQQNIDTSSVQVFVRLRDRLVSARSLLDGHVEFSHFFTALESVTLARLRLTTLTANIMPDGTASVHMAGTAANFNALAAESAALGNNPLIKDAVFSGIAIDKTGGINFNLVASLDSGLVIGGKGAASASPPPGSSTSTPAASSLPTL